MILVATLVAASCAAWADDAAVLYLDNCASCHGAQRLGGIGPALLPQNLSRIRKDDAHDVIENGRALTQMPAYGELLDAEQIALLTEYIYREPETTPSWGVDEIRASHVQHFADDELGDEPVFDADLQNLFVVVELGDHHATLLDGDTFEPIHRFKTRFALHGGPKYDSSGRFVYFASRDGWISKFDIYNLKTVAEVRAGINTRNAAVSADGEFVAVGNYLPHSIVILDAATLQPLSVLPVEDGKGNSSRVSAVYTARNRGSFIAALKDLREIWEIDYREQNANAIAPRRIKLDNYLDDFFFSQDYSVVMGAARPAGSGRTHDEGDVSGQVVSLDSGEQIAELRIPGMPHLGSGITWPRGDSVVMATPNLGSGTVSVIDMHSWEVVKTLETLGPGFFMRSHEQSPYAWVDVFFGPHKDKVHVFDKETLELVRTLQPAPGKTAAHVEFTKDGRYALLSVWEDDGAIVVYDAKTLQEIKRLPMRKPSGKYNVYNKTSYSSGTSH